MTFINMSCQHVTFFIFWSWNHKLYFFIAYGDMFFKIIYLGHGATNHIFSRHAMKKITCLSTPPYIYIVYINAHIHQGFEPKNSGKCTKVLTTKSFQEFNIKEKKLI